MPADDALRRLVESGDAYGTVLALLVVDRYGAEALSWHPAALRRQLELDLGYPVPPSEFDKLMAAATVLTTDVSLADAASFSAVASALCGNGFHPGTPLPLSPAECAWAVVETALLDPTETGYAPEVRRFLGVVVRNDGFLEAPVVLRTLADMPPASGPLSPDPELAAEIHAGQREKHAKVREALTEGLRELVGQIVALPLRGGDAAGVAQRAEALIAAVAGPSA
jgi:hypothetical protein